MTDKKKNLYYLHELSDYKVASDDPDVRGWAVKDKDNRVIGKVDNLLVNKEREQVVYLDVEVDPTIIEANHDPYGTPSNSEVHEFINKDGEEHIIIPVGLVSLNEDQKFVYTDRIDHQTFAETKRIQKGSPIEREYEVVVLESFDRFGDPDERNRENDRYRDSFNDRDRNRSTLTDDPSEQGRDFETRADDTYDDRYRHEELRPKDATFDDDNSRSSEDRLTNEGIRDSRERKGRIPDDDSFYDRREFDRTNYRRRR